MHRLARFALIVTAAVVLAAGGVGVASGASSTPAGPTNPGAPPVPAAPAHAAALNKPFATVGSAGNRETVFVPITPCRIANTRSATSDKTISDGNTRSFYVKGTQMFQAQGGQGGGCGIPTTATAVATTVTTLDAALIPGRATAYLLGYPTGGAVPTASFTAFKAGTATSNPVLPLAATEPSLTVKSLFSTEAVAIDVVGYYNPQIHALLNSNGGIFLGSSRVLSSTLTSTGRYTVAVSGDLTNCTPMITINGGAFIGSAIISGQNVIASTYTTSGTAVNLYWDLAVIC